LEAQCCSAEARANKEEWHRLAEEAEPAALGGSLLIILLTAKTRAAGWKRLEVQAETASREVPGEPKTLQHEAEQLSSSPPDALEAKAEKTADQINLDEAATRAIIDEQLRDVALGS
jgi:type I restriction enzyme, R subunit